ncbi:TetR/AcrR family transcriptional regulator [Nocardiopsis composta]|uniref:AcrR family transcriptional regulator n=1 Tax=Nocardiopsis composta TaxID=157465 RepID=A0A7W8QKU0_9ACTN|nr:TetR family transcriptional regulator [Nocardiopsis composta]MBB5432064.1 AcrR family transcriptional regulator [Nocardiopsis composta]
MPKDGPEGLRERKKRMTRAALRAAAVRLFSEHGPEAVTVEEICAEAGVSPRTFFNYFAAKEETLLPFTRDDCERFAREVAERPAHEQPQRAVRAVLEAAIGRAVAGPTWREEAALLRRHPVLAHRGVAATRSLRRALTEGLARRLGPQPPRLYLHVVASVSVAAMQAAVNAWQEDPEEGDVLRLLGEAFDRVEAGLAPPEE